MDKGIWMLHPLQKSPAEYFQKALNVIKEIIHMNLTSDQEAYLFIELGKVCDLSGEWDRALENYQRALELCKSDEIKAEALKRTGHIRSKRGDWEAALQAYEDSLAILNRIGNFCEAGNIYNNIGYNHFETGDMARAKEYYDKALEIAQRCNDNQLVADVQNNLGIFSNVKGQTDDALNRYEQSMLRYKAIGDTRGLAQVYHNLAKTYVDRADWELAGEHYQKSMELCIELGDIDFLSVIYVNRAQLALRLHDPYVAKLYCDKAFESFSKTGNKLGLAEVHKLYGITYSNMQKWEPAEREFHNGIEICEECDNHLAKAEIYYELGSMNHKRHDKKEALLYMRKAVEAYKALGIDKEVSKISAEIQTMEETQ